MDETGTIETTEEQPIKCVVWDLDNTIWDGVLLEDEQVFLRAGIPEILRSTDERGILLSIASRNDHDVALAKLKELGIEDYFLYPQINWSNKSLSIQNIAKSLNIGLDTFAFVDDEPFERDEVNHVLPEVLCFDATDLSSLLAHPRMTPRFITAESKYRRHMYQSDKNRKEAEAKFTGPSEEFLKQLDMAFKIKRAQEEDLKRAEELTVRTHQLNATGYTYSYDELSEIRQKRQYLLLIASLEDKYGAYGTIGLALVHKDEAFWTVKLLLMSCRVMSRGLGTIMMSFIMSKAKEAGVGLRAEFVPNDRNRMMYVTYKFSGFTEVGEENGCPILENDLSYIQPFPNYVKVDVSEVNEKSILGD